MPKVKITQEQYDRVVDQAAAAQEFLTDERYAFLLGYLESGLHSVEHAILNNTVREVTEIVPITDKITRMFKTPKKEQVDELAGQYKYITKLLADWRMYITIREELDADIASGRVVLVTQKDENG